MTETPPSTPQPVATQPDLSAIKVPLLISGILNCLTAIGWISSCFLFFLGIPLIVLAIFEFKAFAELNKPGANPPEHKGKTQVLGILECCSFLLGSVGSAICGIVVLVNLNKMDEPAA
ncbi:MAG: hypothetical protein RIB32_02100 [Phycisphaerales bacterium]